MTFPNTLGNRMKRYEEASRLQLLPRTPVIVRVDGKAFHTYAASCVKPFDVRLSDVMLKVAERLCKEIQGAQLAYTQSDEISVLVHGYKRYTSEPWFGNQVQKVCSVAAGIASAQFTAESWRVWAAQGQEGPTLETLKPAVFDARCFALPEAEVCNYFVWRQQDAERNSVQALARSMFSHTQCMWKGCDELREMCVRAGHPGWDSLEPRWRRGSCVVDRSNEPLDPKQNGSDGLAFYVKQGWWPDHNIPIFSQDRNYIERHLAIVEED